MRTYARFCARVAEFYANLPFLRRIPGFSRYYRFIARQLRQHPYRTLCILWSAGVASVVVKLAQEQERHVLVGRPLVDTEQ